MRGKGYFDPYHNPYIPIASIVFSILPIGEKAAATAIAESIFKWSNDNS